MHDQTIEPCNWCGRRESCDTHHLVRRSDRPDLITEPKNLVRLCRECHDWATKDKSFEIILQQYFFARIREPKLSVEYIAEQLKERSFISPRDVVRWRNWLAGEYTFLSARYVEAKIQKSITFSSQRPKHRSKADAELAVGITDEGREVEYYKSVLASIEQMQSALFTTHRQYEKESYNSM